tara:strand:+ start:349 stop:768 length:420 start_codon:yes stop_codon:yes gene_type:complete
MSVQLALLKSGEEVIADIKEFRDSDDNLVSYFFGEPHCIKIKTQEILIEAEDAPPKHEVIFYKWMGLSKDKDIIVNKDWVVCITDPLDSIVESYGKRNYGRDQSSDRRDDVAPGSTNGTGTPDSTGTLLNEQVTFTEHD